MKLMLFSIRDALTGFLPISVDHNEPSAIRNFEHACKNVQSLFYSSPADYTLCHVGSFDTDTGSITPCDPRPVVNASSFFVGDKNEK